MNRDAIINESTPADIPSIAILEAIAAWKGVDPLNLDQTLYDVIDPDALDGLFAQTVDGRVPTDIRITFTYDGLRIEFDSDGGLELTPISDT